jgi:phosphoglycolate phosphatase
LKKLSKKKLIIFDLDGVLIDSIKNMKNAWNSTNKKYKLNVKFSDYFKHIGKPFCSILKSLSIFNKIKLIEKEYSKISIKNFNKIKLFKNVKKVINLLQKKNNIITAIVTSKDHNRTKKILKFFKLKVDYVQCPQKGLRGKPHPDQLIKVVQKYKISKRNCFYIGDTIFDKEAAAKSKINFIFAKYGYKIGIKKYKYSVNNILETMDLINESK